MMGANKAVAGACSLSDFSISAGEISKRPLALYIAWLNPQSAIPN